MNFDLAMDISVFAVFLQGLLSFFSPCVFPLIPVYMSYLAGGLNDENKNQFKIFCNTLGFVLGISFVFFLLGLSFTAIGQLLNKWNTVIRIVGGVFVLLFGLYSMGLLNVKAFQTEHRIKNKVNLLKLNPLTSFVFGLTFSFAWTPCVGPALTSVLLMTSSAETMTKGLILICVYIFGFVIPFLFLGCFTGFILDFFKKRRNIVKYTTKIGGCLLIIMGVLMISGMTNGLNSYLSGAEISDNVVEEKVEKLTIFDKEFMDQNGNYHKLSDYRGKVVFLNFWATWCGPCQYEIPDIQSIYEEYGLNKEDVIVMGIANPKTMDYLNNQDISIIELSEFIKRNNMTYPVLMDITGEAFSYFGIQSLPTTYMIDVNGDIYGYISGMLSKDMMIDIITQTQEAVINEE